MLNKYLLFVGLLSILMAGGWIGWHEIKAQGADWLPVRFVRVEGTFEYLTKDDVQRVLEGQLINGIYNVDLGRVHDLVNALPWVQKVIVKRQWPDVIDIKIVEQKALVRWGEKGLLNKEGERFFPDNYQEFGDLPLIVGPVGNEKKLLQVLQSFNAALKKQGFRLFELHVNDRRSWSLKLLDGMQIKLGRNERNERNERFERFLRTLNLLGMEQIGFIAVADLRYTNGYAISWKENAPAIDWKKIAELNKL
jgi:cell division protein FtsQ